MLVHEHARGDAAHVEAVQEVLNVLVSHRVHAERLLVLHHPLSHGGHHVVVPVPHRHQRLREPEVIEAEDRGVSGIGNVFDCNAVCPHNANYVNYTTENFLSNFF